MFSQTWSHDIIRKYVVVFGTLFNNIYITRDNSSSEEVQTLKIPLSYGPKEKFLTRVDGDPDLANKVAIVLPRMSFEMISFAYAPDRKMNNLNKICSTTQSDAAKSSFMYSPVPYDITFELVIMTKNAEDGSRIIEQILPYFNPHWTISATLVDGFDPVDLPVVLNDVNLQDTYAGDFVTRRAIIWTLTFTMKAYVFGPTRKKSIIKVSDVTFRQSTDTPIIANTSIANSVVITTKPGLTVDGLPTSNASLSIDYDEIKSTDDYGFIHEYTEDL